MNVLDKNKDNQAATVLRTRRFQCGVEILEQEMHQVVVLDERSAGVEPRLVVGDGFPSVTKLFIAKTRSEIAGLDTLLQALIRPALNAK